MGAKLYLLVRSLIRAASNDPDGFIAFISWIISAFIVTLIVALIVGGIAKLNDKDFEEWFTIGAIVWGIIELINGIIIMCS